MKSKDEKRRLAGTGVCPRPAKGKERGDGIFNCIIKNFLKIFKMGVWERTTFGGGEAGVKGV